MRFPARSIFLSALLVACSAGTFSPNPVQSLSIENRGSEVTKWWENLPRKEWADFERVLPDTEWFQIYRIALNVYAIYEPGHFEEIISFLIIGDDKALLFDTGLGLAPIKPVIEQLTDKALIVINSHSHYDHVGGNHEFDVIIGLDNPFYAQTAKGLSNDKVAEFVKGDWLPVPPSPYFTEESYEVLAWNLSEFITDGDVIDLGGRTLEVIKAPGESPDGLCLFDRENRLLFIGDIFYLGPLYAHLPESDFEAYKRSVDRLAKLAPNLDYLITSHNVPIAEASYLIKLKDAFHAVAEQSAHHVETDGALEYEFDGFSILAPPE